MAREPGLFPTLYLRVLASQRAAAPGDRVSLRVEGTDAGSLIRGKSLGFEQERDGDWHYVDTMIAAQSAEQPSRWIPPGSGSFVVTAEGYSATSPLYFAVPPLEPGDYRVRLDATHANHEIGDLQRRTATFYVPLHVMAPRE